MSEKLLDLVASLNEAHAFVRRHRSDPLEESGCGCIHVRNWPRVSKAVRELLRVVETIQVTTQDPILEKNLDLLLKRLDEEE